MVVLDQLVNGLALGALYALIAAGVAVIFGVVGIVNFAHGELYMLGAYLFYLAHVTFGLPYIPGLVVTIAGMAAFGALIQLVVVRRIVHRPWQSQLVATLGLSILFLNFIAVAVGTDPRRAFTSLTRATLSVGSVSLSYQRVALIVVTLVAFAALHQYVRHSRMGKAMRAVSQNREACVTVGVDVQHVAMVTFAIAAALAGLAAALYAPLVTITPTMGQLLIIKAFVVVIIGGFGRLDATVAAALGLGVAESFVIQYVSATYVDVFAFIIMLGVLLARPHGLFDRRVGI